MNHIITGGSADRSGIIQLGDVVVSVDSKDVRGKVSLRRPWAGLTLTDSAWFRRLQSSVAVSLAQKEGSHEKKTSLSQLIRASNPIIQITFLVTWLLDTRLPRF